MKKKKLKESFFSTIIFHIEFFTDETKQLPGAKPAIGLNVWKGQIDESEIHGFGFCMLVCTYIRRICLFLLITKLFRFFFSSVFSSFSFSQISKLLLLNFIFA